MRRQFDSAYPLKIKKQALFEACFLVFINCDQNTIVKNVLYYLYKLIITLMNKIKIILSLFFLIIVISIFYFRIPKTLIQNFYPETKIESGRIVVVKSANNINKDSIDGGSTSFNSLVLINIKNNQSNEITIDNFFGPGKFFQGAVIADNQLYYLKQENSNLSLMAYNIDTKEKKLVDTTETKGSNQFSSDKIISKLFYDYNGKKIILYNGGSIKEYSVAQVNLIKTIKLWDITTGKGASLEDGAFKLTPDASQLLVGDNFSAVDPISITYSGGDLFAVFADLSSKSSDGGLYYSCKYSDVDYDSIGGHTAAVKCDLSGDYGCSIDCPSKETFLKLNRLEPGNVIRDNVLTMADENEFIIKNKVADPLRLNCGGYFQIGPCLRYHIDTLRKINSKETVDLYSEGTGYSDAWNLANIIVSSDKKYVAYSNSKDYGGADTFIVSTAGKTRPRLLFKGAYPLYFDVQN